MKKELSNPPVIISPNNKGHFTLVSDTRAVAHEALCIKKKVEK